MVDGNKRLMRWDEQREEMRSNEMTKWTRHRWWKESERKRIRFAEERDCPNRFLELGGGRAHRRARTLCRCWQREVWSASRPEIPRPQVEGRRRTKDRGTACCPNGSVRVFASRAGERTMRR